MRKFTSFLVVVVGLAYGLQSTPAWAKVEAIEGKRYVMGKEHGPWMIMVTSLWGESAKQSEQAEKASTKLVMELRRAGIPAYLYMQGEEKEDVSFLDRSGRSRDGYSVTQRQMIAVMAGNFPNIEDKGAQKNLKFVKNFRPEVLKQAGYNGTAKDKGPLAGAFLTMNPLLKPEEIARRVRDPLLLQLNSGSEYSLLENKGKYSLIVASFYGNSKFNPKPSELKAVDEMQLAGHKRADSPKLTNLDTATMQAWELVKTMRNNPELRARKIEAYLYNDRVRSVVTVGAFNSPNDPAIRELTEMFRAKYKRNPTNGEEVLISESIQLPGPAGQPPLKAWTMDPVPTLMEVPTLK